MPVYQIERDMPAKELSGWVAHLYLSREEAEREQAKRKR